MRAERCRAEDRREYLVRQRASVLRALLRKYKSNTGVFIQFAATGALIYGECKKQGLGRELPGEWFGTDLSEWMDKGFMPSP